MIAIEIGDEWYLWIGSIVTSNEIMIAQDTIIAIITERLQLQATSGIYNYIHSFVLYCII
jgi:hypothetical protein